MTVNPSIPTTDGRRTALVLILALLPMAALWTGCAPAGTGRGAGEPPAGGETWSVTAWGELYEVFPEVDALVAGRTAVAHTHVTVLDDFSPMESGQVEIVLRGAAGERAFAARQPSAPGIFPVELRPEAPGEYELALRITSAAGEEEIRGGRVRVGTSDEPGGVLVAPAPRAGRGGEPLPFLKEQQWRTSFRTAWVRRGSLSRAAEGLARLRPSAGGEVVLTAPEDGVVRASPWPWPGLRLARGKAVFHLVPRPRGGRSLPELETRVAALEAELAPARSRLARLEELIDLEAVSRRELEEAGSRVATLEARLAAGRRNLDAARSARTGGGAEAFTVAAPFDGVVAAVTASPGAAVEAGEPLARLVRTDRLWVDVALAPRDTRGIEVGTVDGLVLEPSGSQPLSFGPDEVRLVSVAPEIDAGTGKVPILLEVPGRAGLVLGTRMPAQILLAERDEGIVVPRASLVDDGGVPVVYLQLAGERFVRQPVEVLGRRGGRALVEGLLPGQRLVTRGAEAIRRSSLLQSGEAHGHVH